MSYLGAARNKELYQAMRDDFVKGSIEFLNELGNMLDGDGYNNFCPSCGASVLWPQPVEHRDYCALEKLKQIIIDRDNLEKDLRALGIE